MYLLHGEPKPICEFFHHWANDNDHSPCSYGKRFDSIYRPLFSWSAHITCHVRRQKGIADAHKNANTYRKDDKQQYCFYNNVGGRVFSLVIRAKQSSYTHCIFHKPNGLLYYSKGIYHCAFESAYSPIQHPNTQLVSSSLMSYLI